MVQIHPGPPFHRAGSSIADRRTDIAEAGGAEPPRRTIYQRSRSSMYRAPRFERGGCRRKSCREHHFIPGVAQQQRHSAQNGASAGATPAAGTISLP